MFRFVSVTHFSILFCSPIVPRRSTWSLLWSTAFVSSIVRMLSPMPDKRLSFGAGSIPPSYGKSLGLVYDIGSATIFCSSPPPGPPGPIWDPCLCRFRPTKAQVWTSRRNARNFLENYDPIKSVMSSKYFGVEANMSNKNGRIPGRLNYLSISIHIYPYGPYLLSITIHIYPIYPIYPIYAPIRSPFQATPSPIAPAPVWMQSRHPSAPTWGVLCWGDLQPTTIQKKNRTGSHRGVILQLKMVEKTEYLQCSFLNFHPHVSKELLPQKIWASPCIYPLPDSPLLWSQWPQKWWRHKCVQVPRSPAPRGMFWGAGWGWGWGVGMGHKKPWRVQRVQS